MKKRVVCALLLSSTASLASEDTLFGRGAKSASLAQSDTADAEPTVAAFASPTRAATPGIRAQLGYRYARPRLTLAGSDAGVTPMRGFDVDLQVARAVGRVTLGAATSIHLPDRGLAHLSFRPASEPVWLRWDSGQRRASADGVVALATGGWGVALGGSATASTAGGGVDLVLPQDERGPHADGAADVEVRYRVAPIAAVSWDVSPVALALRYRGATSIPLDLPTVSTVQFADNPLNGVTKVRLHGVAAYDPAIVTLASRVRAGSLTLFTALDYARWSAAPPVAVSLDLDVKLGLQPYAPSGVAPSPALRDTLTPRIGLSFDRPWVGARVGVALEPSATKGAPTDVIDPSRVVVAGGVGGTLARAAGVVWRGDLFASVHHMAERTLSSRDATLPFAGARAGGDVWVAGVSLRGELP